ncbi:MFS transporter [Promicromonospora sukumoe]|uniref:MFS family permease n=1 Tax=Promicromonospora sukumoe TaxID=88382 RepID=A0A7W3PDN0_9MICO|nr:MFS transporter [Promicromonospora sukumoe]MBA8807958.1 MFS family permease [Promicromonospora sukumoe]
MTATVSPASRARTNAQIDAGPGSLSPGGQRLVLIGMIALCSLGAFEALAVATAMPTIAVDLDGLRHYTFAFAVVFATSVVGMLTAGRWCDRTGPTPAMWTGVALFVVGLVVAGTATGMGALIAGRAVQGVGSGLFGVALYVLVARVFVAERRPAVFSAFAAAWVVPAIVGPGLAGLVVDHLGWRWVFLGAAVLTVPAAILMRPGLTAARGEGRVSAEGVVSDGVVSDRVGLDGTGLDGAVLDGESNGGRDTDAGPEAEAGTGRMVDTDGGTRPVPVGGLVGDRADARVAAASHGVASDAPRTGADDRADAQPERPVVQALRLALSVLRAGRGLPAVVSVRALVSGAFTGAEVLLPLLLVHERHLSPGGAGLILTVGALGWSGASWVRGRNLLHLSHAGYVRLGGGLLALGTVGAALLVLPGVPAGVGMAFWVLSGSGMGLVYPTLSVLTLELAPPHEQGSASSALQVADAVAAAIASSATGALLWTLYDVAGLPAYAVVLGLTGLLAATAVLLAGRTRVVGSVPAS